MRSSVHARVLSSVLCPWVANLIFLLQANRISSVLHAEAIVTRSCDRVMDRTPHTVHHLSYVVYVSANYISIIIRHCLSLFKHSLLVMDDNVHSIITHIQFVREDIVLRSIYSSWVCARYQCMFCKVIELVTLLVEVIAELFWPSVTVNCIL